MIITLIICIAIVLIIIFICSVYVNIKRQQINNQKELEEYRLNSIYTKNSAVNDIFTIKKLIFRINDEFIIGDSNKQNIDLIKEILEDYIETED